MGGGRGEGGERREEVGGRRWEEGGGRREQRPSKEVLVHLRPCEEVMVKVRV